MVVAGLVKNPSRPCDDFFETRLYEVDQNCRAETREIRQLVGELRQDFKDMRSEMKQLQQKLDVVIFDLHRISFNIKH